MKDFLLMPAKTGMMALVLFFAVLFGVSDIFASETPVYDKDWVLLSTKTWTKPNSAFQTYIQDGQTGEMVLRDSYDFTSTKKCIVIAKYNSEQNSYHAYAITTKEGTNETPFKQGQAGWDNTPSLSNAGNGNFNMTNVFSDWYSVFPEWTNTDYWVSDIYDTTGVPETRWGLVQYDLSITSASELRSTLEENNFNPPITNDDTKLPMLHYRFSQQTTYGAQLPLSKIKEIMEWNYSEYEVYSNNPTNFYVEMVASTHWKSSPTGVGDDVPNKDITTINPDCNVTVSNGGCNVSTNYYSFFYADIGTNLYGLRGYSFNDVTGYYFYVRTHEIDGGRVSDWKVYNMALNGVVSQVDVIISDDGQVGSIDDEDKDDQTITAPTYTPDNSTSAGSDPSSTVYDGSDSAVSASTLMATLRSMVNDLQDLPSMLSTTISFLPQWLITLIALGLGIFIIVGIVKLIIK